MNCCSIEGSVEWKSWIGTGNWAGEGVCPTPMDAVRGRKTCKSIGKGKKEEKKGGREGGKEREKERGR